MSHVKGTSTKVKAAAAVIAGLIDQYDSPAASALLAAELVRLGWSPRRARGTTGANNAYLHTARHLTPEQHQKVESGIASLAYFHNAAVRNGNGATY